MKTLNNSQCSIIALITEIVLVVLGIEFFCPHPVEKLAADPEFRGYCLVFYVCCWLLTIVLVRYCTNFFAKTKALPMKILILIALVLVLAPIWYVPLAVAAGVTIVSIVHTWKKPSDSWRLFFIVNKKNNNIRQSYIINL